MSMFDWMAEDGSPTSAGAEETSPGRLLSKWFWLFWAITAPLTIGILIFWVLWFKRTDRKYKERREQELDEETKIE